MRLRRAALLTALLVPLTFGASHSEATGGPPPGHGTLEQHGVVRSGSRPIAAAEVTLFQAGGHPGAGARPLARTRSDAHGRFSLSYRAPKAPDAVLYLTADARPAGHGHSRAAHRVRPVRLVTMIGTGRRTGKVVLNERTTVAAGFAMAQFTQGGEVAGRSPGLQNAAAVSHNLADIDDGAVAEALATAPNGEQTSTLRAFNTLADILSGCTAGQTCDTLFELAGHPGAPAPRETFQAVADIARLPGNHAAELFALAEGRTDYLPKLTKAPDAWTIALRYVGNGHELDGPGNVAFDAEGTAWIGNNYTYGADPRRSVCGSRILSRLTPTGQDVPGAPYRGGGLYGVGFGTAIDPDGHVWAANFGFQGSDCPLDASRLYRSISEFTPDGRPLSPPRGWRRGDIVQPQGTVSDREGNIWVANCGGRSVTRIPQGDAHRARNIAPGGDSLIKPFGVTVDTRGRAWVTGNGSDSVTLLSPQGRPLRSITGGGIKRPMGVASDTLGNVWVANGGAVVAPCEGTTPAMVAEAVEDVVARHVDASVTLIRPDGTTPAKPFVNDGLFLPWGIAVDGNDTVWVANFGGHRLANLCGARVSACPPGLRTGDAISPAGTGYTSDGLERNTAVQIDPSGNVWLANNWMTVPLQTNPGGHEMVVFVGLAAPVRTPLLGPPRHL
ncbi:NHL repeat-containing protein [Streptomyces sp. TRM49041]|uniref:NHL repeat-containing protein n=1 Tax=Streptomyces sp. TRM49041 TaxID=2603216 RepID=UPI0011EBA787|nr:NHL repeat-containing protein [Streptomyces sp. TRM49041]